MARNFAEKLEDQDRKKQILDACDTIPEWYQKLGKHVRFALDNPKDPNAQKDLEKTIQGTKDAVAKIVALTYDDPENRIIQNASELNADLDTLVKATKKGDETESNVVLKRVVNKMSEQGVLGRVLAGQKEDNDPMKKKIMTSCEQLDTLEPMIGAHTKQALKDPKTQPVVEKNCSRCQTS